MAAGRSQEIFLGLTLYLLLVGILGHFAAAAISESRADAGSQDLDSSVLTEGGIPLTKDQTGPDYNSTTAEGLDGSDLISMYSDVDTFDIVIYSDLPEFNTFGLWAFRLVFVYFPFICWLLSLYFILPFV